MAISLTHWLDTGDVKVPGTFNGHILDPLAGYGS